MERPQVRKTLHMEPLMNDTRKKAVFVSGHIDLTKEEFATHYVPQLREALEDGASFVVGDATGCDFMAQRWLWKNAGGRCRHELCRVFHMLESPRHSFCSGFGSHDPNSTPSGGGFPLVGGFTSDDERDAAMTDASTHDIAWVRPERKKKNSGTAKNLQRRVERLKAARAAEIASWPTAAVSVDVDGCDCDYKGYVVRVEQAAEQDIVDEDKKLCRVPQPLIDRLSAAQARIDVAQREHSTCQRELMQLLVEQGLNVDVRHAQLVQIKE